MMEERNGGRIAAVCVSEKKGERKKEVPSALLVKDWGIEGDAHAGKWKRQVSALDAQDAREMEKETGMSLPAGAFAENLLMEGIDLRHLPIGSVLRTQSGARLELAQIGKQCHSDCAIKRLSGKCVMPQKGMFFKVLEGGSIAKGDVIEVVSTYAASVIVVSTSCCEGSRIDEAGEAVIGILRDNGFGIKEKRIVPDDIAKIKDTLVCACARSGLEDEAPCHLALTVGGTGFSPSDVTPEATLEVVERRCDGLIELMRSEGAKSSSYAYLSRAVAGIRSRTLVVNLPGSAKGASESLRAIMGVLGHALRMLCGDPRH